MSDVAVAAAVAGSQCSLTRGKILNKKLWAAVFVCVWCGQPGVAAPLIRYPKGLLEKEDETYPQSPSQ